MATVGSAPASSPTLAKPRAWPQPLFSEIFALAEHSAYALIGLLLTLTAGVALAGAGLILWQGLQDWSGTQEIFKIVDRLLFVLMLIEILYTLRASFHSGGLPAEPFLIAGLIACIRRVLVITLQTSEAMSGREWTTELQQQFRASIIELTVLGALILIMVTSIYILHRSYQNK